MPRANRYRLPGHVWHITHRCHRQDFLLKFARDRRVWRTWLFETRKKFRLCVPDYIWTEEALKTEQSVRDENWSQCLAMGSRQFIARFQSGLGTRAPHRGIESDDDRYCLREGIAPYHSHSVPETMGSKAENVVFLDESV